MEWTTLLRVAGAILLCIPTVIHLVSKLFFLAPHRVGWLVWAANLVYEIIWKRTKVQRHWVDLAGFVGLGLGWLAVGGPWAAAAVTVVLGTAWGWTSIIDIRWRNGGLAHQDSRYAKVPMPIPHLTLLLRGPVLDRGPICQLGTWPEGHEAEFEVLILNPSLVKPQWPMTLEVRPSNGRVSVVGLEGKDLRAPDPGTLIRVPFRLRAAAAGGACHIAVRLTHADVVLGEDLRLEGVISATDAQPRAAEIRKWKGGARCAFGWRGDQDMYDPATFQDQAGLELSLGLARRFQFPSTVYLSARLSLVPEEHRKFSEHHGWDRRTEEIPDFVDFLREQVHIQAEMDWPFTSERPYFVEVGNHMFHHYGTHASAAEGNNWTMSSIGAGVYDWMGDETDDFSEQRDNAAKCNEVFEEVLGFFPTSFAVPGRDYSGQTAAAVEAAGIRVGSDSDASQWLNVMGMPEPHHPEGVEELVDVTKKYPGDCDNAYKIVMLKYWMHRARRHGGHFLYMAHQHMVRYFGTACYHLTEEVLRYVLGDCHGDFYVSTVSGIALYWDRVLCPEHRVVQASVDGQQLRVENTGDADLEDLPVEVEWTTGGRMMVLTTVPAGKSTSIALQRV